jgi:predicted AAA+ superfamily ATPase
MVNRALKPSKLQSYFLFGPRGVGKSTLIQTLTVHDTSILWIDLLKDEDESLYARKPDELTYALDTGKYKTVIIDEIQKAPKLLDIVHHEIEKKKARFILTGSSARKLKRGGANLLAGRAISYHLHPLTASELGNEFSLENVLHWGALPKLLELPDAEEKHLFLKSYVKTYLKEEIVAEQIIRKVDPFRDFLEVAAQNNGELINHSKIAKNLGVDDKTIKNYYQILEDTLVGFLLKPFHRSVRKRQLESSKFFYFDLGVKRALELKLNIPLHPGSSEYGKSFEHFIYLELIRMNDYYQTDYRFSYLRTKDDAEIDLIVERPGKKELLIEVKSTTKVTDDHVKTIGNFKKTWDRPCDATLWSNDPNEKMIDGVLCQSWQQGLNQLFRRLTF